MNMKYRLAREDDADSLSRRLCAMDVRDCVNRSLTPYEALSEPIKSDPQMTFAVFWDDRIEAMCGIADSDIPGVGHPWLLSSEIPIEGIRPMLRGLRRYLDAAPYGVLYNHVPAHHTVAHRLIWHLGFEIGWPHTLGSKLYFIFVRRRTGGEWTTPERDAALTSSDWPSGR
jgi:hypothetical protein